MAAQWQQEVLVWRFNRGVGPEITLRAKNPKNFPKLSPAQGTWTLQIRDSVPCAQRARAVWSRGLVGGQVIGDTADASPLIDLLARNTIKRDLFSSRGGKTPCRLSSVNRTSESSEKPFRAARAGGAFPDSSSKTTQAKLYTSHFFRSGFLSVRVKG